MRATRLIPLLLLAAGAGAVPGAAELVPNGPEFVVNAHTEGLQTAPSIAPLGPSGMVAVWREEDEEPGGFKARFLDPAGAAVSGEVWIHRGAPFPFFLIVPEVAGSLNGSFVVVWTDQYRIVGRHFKDKSSPGRDLQISPPGGSEHRSPAVAMDAAGNFLVVWTERSLSSLGARLVARRFDSAGSPLGDPFRVAEDRFGHFDFGGGDPKVALHDDGGFLVVWNVGRTVKGRRFHGPGQTGSDELDLGFGGLAVPVLHPEGDGAIVWVDYGGKVRVQPLDASGARRGASLEIGSYADGEMGSYRRG